jgi:predicted DNA-binding protein
MAGRPEIYDVYFQLRISRELRSKFQKLARAKGITASEMVRRLMLNYLEGIGDAIGAR